MVFTANSHSIIIKIRIRCESLMYVQCTLYIVNKLIQRGVHFTSNVIIILSCITLLVLHQQITLRLNTRGNWQCATWKSYEPLKILKLCMLRSVYLKFWTVTSKLGNENSCKRGSLKPIRQFTRNFDFLTFTIKNKGFRCIWRKIKIPNQISYIVLELHLSKINALSELLAITPFLVSTALLASLIYCFKEYMNIIRRWHVELFT